MSLYDDQYWTRPRDAGLARPISLMRMKENAGASLAILHASHAEKVMARCLLYLLDEIERLRNESDEILPKQP